MCEDGFKFEAWLESAHAGLKDLRARRLDLEAQKKSVEEALEETDKEIVALEAMLEAHIGAVPKYEDKPKIARRVTGIKMTAKAIAEDLCIGVEWTEDQLVAMVREKIPEATESSTRKALQALAKEGIYTKVGMHGNWRYSTTIGRLPGEAQEPADEPPAEEAQEDVAAATAQESAQEAPKQGSLLDGVEPPEKPPKCPSCKKPLFVLNGEDRPDCSCSTWRLVDGKWTPGPLEGGTTEAEVIVAIEKEMKKKSHISVGEKNIGWIAADLHCEPKTVRDALKIMVAGDFEFGYEGETKVLRRKAEPGSKEELKRTSIQDRPLFPDADRPPHA
jgi:hypothetical protein